MNFYMGRPVLVIGGLGFIGANLTARLRAVGARLTVVTRSRVRHSDQVLEYEADGIRVLEGDLRDSRAMRSALDDQQIVFNLAGESGAVRSMEDPWIDLDVNGRGSLVLLEAWRETRCSAKLVFIGSRLEYGRPVHIPVDEEHATNPLCLHAVHKLLVEEYLRVYQRLFGLRFTVARVTNPYGPGQPRGRTAYGVVNRLIHLALTDDVLPIYGDGEQRRDYIYIDDVVSALLQLGESTTSDARVYNVGTGIGTRLIDMARAITETAGGGRIESVGWPSLAEQIETGDFVADISRIRRELGWQSAITLREGLERTVAFYRARVAS